MSKKVLIISTSPRKNGNSASLAEEFRKGAVEAGNEVDFISLHDKTISFCKGCFACLETHRCIIHDDADIIREKMLHADVIVFATPIYYYEMSGQMKTMLDRANPLYSADYAFRDIYMLSTAAEDEESVPNRAVSGLEGWIACFEKARLAGTLFCGGVNNIGDITENPKLKEAYNMGKSV